MSNSNIDTTVSNYSVNELMSIISITNLNYKDIITNTNALYAKFKNTNNKLAQFFKDIQYFLIDYINTENNGNKITEGFDTYDQAQEWYENENLTQTDDNQLNKITDRTQKIDVYDDEHLAMNRQQIATTDTYQLPVKQDSLNPNLKNTITRFINLDSQFRQYTSGADSSATEYTLDLSDTLKDTLNMRLYSFQIPYSWYSIDTAYGNNCLWVIDSSNNYAVSVSVSSGNYSTTSFVTELSGSFGNAGFSPTDNIVTYNTNSGKITLNLSGVTYTQNGETYNITTNTIIMFYDFTGYYKCTSSCNKNHYFNNTLGWLMGYRLPYVNVDMSGNAAPAILDLNGTKYLILAIDDYNQNHVNNGIVSISQFSNTLKIPSYYSADLPYTCITPAQQGNNLQQLINDVTTQSLIDTQSSAPLNGLLVAGKYQEDYTSTQIVLPSAPRTLTNAQIYTINQINSNRNNLTNYLAKAPTSGDILAVLPIKVGTSNTGNLLIEYSGSLQDNKRIYFGPVDIDRLAVKLLDDKGNILNLNGNDWCVTLICECLYQY